MNVIDTILNEWSFRCHDGVVDLNNPTKLSILHEIIEEYEMNEAMLSLKSIQKRPDQFINIFYSNTPFELGATGGNFFTADSITVGNETFTSDDDTKKSDLEKAILKTNNARNIKVTGQLDGQETSVNVSAIYKSSNLGGQSGGGAGVKNEKNLVDSINSFVEENGGPIDVKFIDKENKEINIPGVTKAAGMGTTGSKLGLKGDVTLFTTDGEQNISVKKDGPYWWSSERKNFNELLNKFIEGGQKGAIPKLQIKPNLLQPKILDMLDPEDGRKYGRVFILNYPGIKDNLENITFGPDKAKIVQRTFTPEDYSLENGTLTIKTTRNMNDINDLQPGDMPIILLARHENQKYGIDFRTIPLKQAKLEPTRGGKTLAIDYNTTQALQ